MTYSNADNELQSYYTECMKRLTHEYDQRDRDFLMHTTVAAALFAAVGFVVKYLRYDEPVSWVLVGLVLAIVAHLGVKVATALKDSVDSFTYWQKFIRRHVADIEARLLPEGMKGLHTEAQEATNLPKDVTVARASIADALRIAWFAIAAVSVLLMLFGAACIVMQQSSALRGFGRCVFSTPPAARTSLTVGSRGTPILRIVSATPYARPLT